MAAGELPAEPIPGLYRGGARRPEPTADFAANAAMVSARAFRQPPRKIAETLLPLIFAWRAPILERAEVAGPGFLNFFLAPAYYARGGGRRAGRGGQAYGRSDYGQGKKVLVEFVSANPTGPMHIGNARGGRHRRLPWPRCWSAAGYRCQPAEFYINDAGNQINKFGLSLEPAVSGAVSGRHRNAGGLLSRSGHH